MLFDFLTLSCALYARALFPDLANAAHAYPMLGMKTLPDGLFGLFLISLIATVLSTFNSFSFMAAQTLGQDFIGRSMNLPKEFLHSLCIIITLILSSILVIFVPSAVDMWYLLASLFLPALLFALVASIGLFPKILINNSASCISLLLLSSAIYQVYS
jgi:SSS family solute:Na+ symporter